MKNSLIHVLILLALPCTSAIAQKKLKKADRIIVANIQTHVNYLKSEKLGDRKAGSEGERLADEYIVKQFSKAGLKPRGEKQWYQTFTIYDGKEIKGSSSLKINEDVLKLHEEYFPFAFSANKNTEAAVAIALSENGVPWFKDIKELINEEDSARVDTFQVIRTKAIQAAAKGASALIIYSSSPGAEISYNRYDTSATVDIPVLYITGKAFKKYSSEESEIIDVKLSVELEPKSRAGNNVIGYADNGADSTVVTTAHLNGETEVAALLEVARLVKNSKSAGKNYLFVTFCGENDGKAGENYLNDHPAVSKGNVNRTLKIDSLAETVGNPKGLNLVKRSIEIIKSH
jgi:hypothetical protein